MFGNVKTAIILATPSPCSQGREEALASTEVAQLTKCALIETQQTTNPIDESPAYI